jgi:gamma-glutamylcyclotransferase (GGCT)/AIG2-like uncharacterized protein YtfP
MESAQPDRLAVNPEALFVYGTLMFPGILVALIGRVPDSTPATVTGWRVAALPERSYPGLVPAVRATAEGRLLTGLTPGEWRVIDTFENGGYDLTRVALVDGRRAWTYTWKDDIAPLPHDWSPDRFAAEHLAGYVERLTAWRP